MTKKIYVGNLAAPTTEQELGNLFERMGRVMSVRIMRDRDTGHTKGFGFVEMGEGEAEQAVQQLNGVGLHGHALSVTEARPRSEPSSRGSLARLFVGNLPYEATAAEIKDVFSAVGPVAFVSLPVDRESGRPRGFAFVDFSERAHAEKAIRHFHQQPFKGRTLMVSEARARESRLSSPFPPRVSPPRTENPSATLPDEPATRPGGSRRHFGPDASPRQNRKPPQRGSQPERRGKPLRERRGGQFFSEEEGDLYGTAFTSTPLGEQGSELEGDE